MKTGNKNEQKGSKLFNSFVRKTRKYLNDSGMNRKNEERKSSWRRKQVKWLNEDLYFPFCCLENLSSYWPFSFLNQKKRQMYNKKPFARKIGRFEWKQQQKNKKTFQFHLSHLKLFCNKFKLTVKFSPLLLFHLSWEPSFIFISLNFYCG